MKCFSDTKTKLTNTCNWREELKSAKKVAAKLGIRLITLDLEKQYLNEVIKPMFKSYKKNLTPNPDIACNTIIKFPWLLKEATKNNCDFIATGHYARVSKDKSGYNLLAGKDKNKDQSYFLYELNQPTLKKLILPIGNLTKSEVREKAKSLKLHNHSKPSTKGICFIGNIDFQDFMKKKIKPTPGPIKNIKGNLIGNHPGIQYFTIGQRLGSRLGMTLNKSLTKDSENRLFIGKKLSKTNTIIAVPESHEFLKTKNLKIIRFHLINPKSKIPKSNIKARIRHLGKLHPGKLKGKTFIANKPIPQVAEGQHIVLYNGSKVLAGGEIRL
jgi:tRNA-specific 2-thiouridylase